MKGLGMRQTASKGKMWLAALVIAWVLAGCVPMPPLLVGEPTATPAPPPVDLVTPTPRPLPLATPVPSTPTPAPTALDEGAVRRVEELLERMTLEEKVGQLFLVYFRGSELSPDLRQLIADGHVGGILLFGSTGNIADARQLGALIADAQALAVADGAAVPLLVATDQEGGTVQRLRQIATAFPGNMAVGATGSAENARLMAQVMAAEMAALGINMNLAPVLDVNNNPANPVIGVRSFGSSPETVAAMGVAAVQAYGEAGILATAKHFPGHGDTTVDSHGRLPVIDGTLEQLWAVELLPFQAAIDAGVPAIMTAHVAVPAFDDDAERPATLSAPILEDLLRGAMGFAGLVVTDSLGMGAVRRGRSLEETVALALQAGVDLLAMGPGSAPAPLDQLSAVRHVLDLVESGQLAEARIDRSVRRILLAKATHGILDWQPPDLDDVEARLGTAEHWAIAGEIARQSITLVRDEAGLLPIGGRQRVLLVWPGTIGDLGREFQRYHGLVTLLPVGVDPTEAEVEEAAAGSADVDLVVLATASTQRHPTQVQLVEALAARAPLIVVAVDSPYDLLDFPQVGTYLATYSAVPVSLEALLRVLTGLALPLGHLPVELPGLHSAGHGLTAAASSAE